jgi:hypothetical protein
MIPKCILHHLNEVIKRREKKHKYLYFLEEVGPLESPGYTNRSISLPNTYTPTSNDTTELTNLLNNNIPTTEQLQKDLIKLKSSIDEIKLKFTDHIRDLVTELDDEKKARAILKIELERLQKSIPKPSFTD